MEEEIGLAELGVTARNAALVEAEILQESLALAGDGSGDGAACTGNDGPGDDVDNDLRGDGNALAPVTADTTPAPALGGGDGGVAATNTDSGRRERLQLTAQLSTVETEIAAMETALEAATEALGGVRDEEEAEMADAGRGLHPLRWRESSLQMALLRDRLAGLRDEQERLRDRLAHEKNGMQQQEQQQMHSGSGPAMPPTQPSQRPRFGARARARAGAGGACTRGGPAAATEATADHSAAAGGDLQPQHQPQQEKQMVKKKARRAMVIDDQDDDPLAASAARSSGGGGPGGLALAETEKDRLIRRGLLTPFDRLTGFERKVANAPPAAAAVASVADAG
ncbi:hypothetical protein Vretifemale_14123, partial [Volvox reticuliferus]